MPAAAPDPNPESAALLRDYRNRLPVGDDLSPAEPPLAGLREQVLAKRNTRVYWAGLEELTRTVDAAKGVSNGSTLAALLKKPSLAAE